MLGPFGRRYANDLARRCSEITKTNDAVAQARIFFYRLALHIKRTTRDKLSAVINKLAGRECVAERCAGVHMINYALHLGITYVDGILWCKRVRHGNSLVVAPCTSIEL